MWSGDGSSKRAGYPPGRAGTGFYGRVFTSAVVRKIAYTITGAALAILVGWFS